MPPQDSTVHHAVRDATARGLGAVGLCGIALVHLLDLPGKFHETPYLGWMYVGLMVAGLALAAGLIRSGDSRLWAAAGALAAAVIVGYVLSRTTGLPRAHGDVGNWTEPLGLASLFVEGCVVALSGAVLAERRTGARRRAPAPLHAAEDSMAA